MSLSGVYVLDLSWVFWLSVCPVMIRVILGSLLWSDWTSGSMFMLLRLEAYLGSLLTFSRSAGTLNAVQVEGLVGSLLVVFKKEHKGVPWWGNG